MARKRWAAPAVLCGLMVLLIGCAARSETPEAKGASGSSHLQQRNPLQSHISLPAGVYLGTVLVEGVVRQADTVLALEPQASTFPPGELTIVVLNKWTGLSQGAHRETVRVLGSDGRAILHEEFTDFQVEPASFTLTVAEPMPFVAPVPGVYWVAVELDTVEVARYPFRVMEPAPQP